MKNLKDLGETLNKKEQQIINGGGRPYICNPNGPIVICQHASLCTQDANGNWYCA